ncbi:Chemokine-like protein TAFA-5, partial [Dissostichus eleginoides]
RQSYIRQAVCLHEDSLWSLLLRLEVQNHSPAGTLAADKPGPGPWVSQQGRQQDGATQLSCGLSTNCSSSLSIFRPCCVVPQCAAPGGITGTQEQRPGPDRLQTLQRENESSSGVHSATRIPPADTHFTRIVRSRQWCEMAPCLEGEVCSLLFNRSGWTCTRGSGRIKTVTQPWAAASHFMHAFPIVL